MTRDELLFFTQRLFHQGEITRNAYLVICDLIDTYMNEINGLKQQIEDL